MPVCLETTKEPMAPPQCSLPNSPNLVYDWCQACRICALDQTVHKQTPDASSETRHESASHCFDETSPGRDMHHQQGWCWACRLYPKPILTASLSQSLVPCIARTTDAFLDADTFLLPYYLVSSACSFVQMLKTSTGPANGKLGLDGPVTRYPV